MAPSASKYQSLGQTVSEWSTQSGELQPVTLRRICDWAICGAFPDGTFLLPTGQPIDVLQLHRAMRMAVEHGAWINRDSAFELLQRAIVTKSGIERFCECVGVDAPRSIATLKSRLRRLVGRVRHIGPPDCPNGAKLAAQMEARDLATSLMAVLEKMLPRKDAMIVCDVAERIEERWRSYFRSAQLQADASGDPEIQRRLVALSDAWTNSVSVAAETEAIEGASQHEDEDTGPTQHKRRGVGRPPGSGSFAIEDMQHIEEMRQGILSGTYPSIAAAARALVSKASGGGTSASKEKRLSTRYSEKYPD